MKIWSYKFEPIVHKIRCHVKIYWYAFGYKISLVYQ
jgi:hypothetical protein